MASPINIEARDAISLDVCISDLSSWIPLSRIYTPLLDRDTDPLTDMAEGFHR